MRQTVFVHASSPASSRPRCTPSQETLQGLVPCFQLLDRHAWRGRRRYLLVCPGMGQDGITGWVKARLCSIQGSFIHMPINHRTQSPVLSPSPLAVHNNTTIAVNRLTADTRAVTRGQEHHTRRDFRRLRRSAHGARKLLLRSVVHRGRDERGPDYSQTTSVNQHGFADERVERVETHLAPEQLRSLECPLRDTGCSDRA